jgi:hypothetical protein
MVDRNDPFMIEHRQPTSRDNVFARRYGPPEQGLESFGWFTAKTNYSSKQRFTVTRSFRGPRRTR